jgi:hypothetical protein
MLIKYLYQETEVTERQAIRAALKVDPMLQQEYKELCQVQQLLNSEKRTPSDSTVDNILDHGKKSSELEIIGWIKERDDNEGGSL